MLLFAGGYLVACACSALFALGAGVAESFLITGEPVFCVGFVLGLLLQLLLNCCLFGLLPRGMPPCRCLGRSTVYDAVQ